MLMSGLPARLNHTQAIRSHSTIRDIILSEVVVGMTVHRAFVVPIEVGISPQIAAESAPVTVTTLDSVWLAEVEFT